MITWITIWILLWAVVMGVPNYLFKKYKINYHQYSWQHSLFYLISICILFVVYKAQFGSYFSSDTRSLMFLFLSGIFLFVFWLLLPIFFKSDYYSTYKERVQYSIPKFFEILFQQFAFLGGLLTFGVSPFFFGLVFFAIHIPVALFIPKKFALIFTGGSLFGGVLFSQFQSMGQNGFLIALFIHLSFYILLHYVLSSGIFKSVTPHKR